MKVIILDGSKKNGTAMNGLREILVEELTRRDWQVEPFTLHDLEIQNCVGCFGCWLRTPGLCVIKDAGRDVAEAFIQSDLVVYLTPVTFGSYSSELKKAIDRLACPLLLPFFTRVEGEVHHKRRYEHYPRLIGLGVLPQADAESERIFTTLVSRNALNLHIPAHAGDVVLSTQSPSEIRDKIQTLLKTVEVT